MHNGYQHTSTSSIAPKTIFDALPSLGSIATRYGGYKFHKGRQEDAHEFLIHLLDAMHDGELRDAGIHVRKSGWRDRLPVPRIDETTFVHRVFGGYLRSQVRCTSCGFRSNTYDPFLDLSLEISRKHCNSVDSAFREYTRKETLDSSNRWKCDGCKKRVCATKQLTVFRPPLALIFQLKRFAFGGAYGGNKISKPISYEASMKLPLSDGRSCEYGLTGAVIHVGSSASSGHYTAVVKRPNGHWYLMDDAHSQTIRERDALGQRNAYLLIYSRQEVKIEYPAPPLRTSMTAEQAKELAIVRSQERMLVMNEKPKATSVELTKTTGDSGNGTETTTNPTQRKKVDPDIASDPPTTPLADERAAKTHVEDKPSKDPSVSGGVARQQEKLHNPQASKIPANLNMKCTLSLGNEWKLTPSDPSKQPTSAVDTPSSLKTQQSPSSSSSSSSGDDDTGSDSSSNSSASSNSHQSRTLQVLAAQHPRHAGNGERRTPTSRKATIAWKPTVDSHMHRQDDQFDLLGNMKVERWGDAEGTKSSSGDREKVMKHVITDERDQKKRMFLDHHDYVLDQGKVRPETRLLDLVPQDMLLVQAKKMKNKSRLDAVPATPQNNRFQLIQESMSKMNKGRAKGYASTPRRKQRYRH